MFNYKQQLLQKQTEVHCDDGRCTNKLKRNLTFTRVIGHELDIPGAVEWQMYREKNEECWVCDRKIYTIFFWSPLYAGLAGKSVELTSEEEKAIKSAIFMNRDTNLER